MTKPRQIHITIQKRRFAARLTAISNERVQVEARLEQYRGLVEELRRKLRAVDDSGSPRAAAITVEIDDHIQCHAWHNTLHPCGNGHAQPRGSPQSYNFV